MIFLAYIFFSACIGLWATVVNRGFFKWFFMAILFSPLLSGIFLIFSGNAGKKCEKCSEYIKLEAKKCKHCGHEVVTPEPKNNEVDAAA